MTLLGREFETWTGPPPSDGTNVNGSDQFRSYSPDAMKVSPTDAAKICFQTAGKLIDIGV